jgi:hypothetical protein
MSLPVSVREELHLTAGDVMVIRSEPPCVIATKIDLTEALAYFQKANRKEPQ